MTFLKTNINTEDKKQVYRMTKGDSQKIEGLERGLSLPVDHFALYTEVKDRKKQDGTTEQYEDDWRRHNWETCPICGFEFMEG